MSKYKMVPVEPTPEMIEAGKKEADWYEHNAIYCYQAMLAAAPTVQGEPAIRKLGIMGAAFAPLSVRRAYTYSDQPNNTTAWKLGRAACKERSGGDFIDYGLQMLQYLQEEGFGVFEIDEADPAPKPAEQQPAPDVAGLVDALRAMIDQAQRVSVCGNFSSDVVLRAINALAAYRNQGGDT